MNFWQSSIHRWCEKWNELNSSELILHQISQTEFESYTREKFYINFLLSWATCLVFISLFFSFYWFIIFNVVDFDCLLYFSYLFYSYRVIFLSMLSDDILIEVTDERLSMCLSQSFNDVFDLYVLFLCQIFRILTETMRRRRNLFWKNEVIFLSHLLIKRWSKCLIACKRSLMIKIK